MRYKRKSIFDDLFDMLLELTGYYWQIGAAVCAALLFFAFKAYQWVESLFVKADSSIYLAPVIETIGWMFYILPLMLVVMAYFFGVKTYETYRRQSYRL